MLMRKREKNRKLGKKYEQAIHRKMQTAKEYVGMVFTLMYWSGT